jgi:hypothetical protein
MKRSALLGCVLALAMSLGCRIDDSRSPFEDGSTARDAAGSRSDGATPDASARQDAEGSEGSVSPDDAGPDAFERRDAARVRDAS